MGRRFEQSWNQWGSMDDADRDLMSADFGEQPWKIDASGVSLARRP